MRYHELYEDEDKIEPLFNFFKTVKKECSDIIKVYENEPYILYRGIRTLNNIVELEPPKNRKALNTSNKLQEYLDDWLKKHNFNVLRSNSYFCTSNYDVAKSYGEAYIVFPTNGFNYLWFKKSPDLFETIQYLEDTLSRITKSKGDKGFQDYGFMDDLYLDDDQKENIEQAVDLYMKHIQPTQNELSLALDKSHEIMLTGKYYAIKYNYLPRVIRKNILEILSSNDGEMLEILKDYLED